MTGAAGKILGLELATYADGIQNHDFNNDLKYKALEKHLLRNGMRQIPMTFVDIEAVIEDRLPPSARKHRAWWSNNPSNSVITLLGWLRAIRHPGLISKQRNSCLYAMDLTPRKIIRFAVIQYSDV